MDLETSKSELQTVTSRDSSKHSWYTFNCALLVANGSFLCGMDTGIVTTTISQPTYLDYFKPYTADIAGAVVSAFTVGGFIGIAFAGWAVDKWGRKQSIKFAAIWALVGGAMQAGSVHIGMLIMGRILAGFAAGILYTIPIYAAEIAPKNRRGLIGGLHAQFMGIGYVFANWIGFACSYADSHVQWRLPLAVQCIPALILLVGINLLPYSPRWLLAQGRDDEALVVFKKLNRANNGTTRQDEELLRQFREMQDWIRYDIATCPTSQVVKSKIARKRLFIATWVRLIAPLAGIDTVGYQSIIYKDLGIRGHMVTLLIALCGMAGPAANLVALFCMDRCSRKKALWICCLGMACNMAFIMGFTARYGGSGNKVGQGFTVAWITVMLIFSSGYNSVQSVYLPEILNQAIRARGSSISLCVSTVISVIIIQISPRAFASIGYKFYSVFICTDLIGAVVILCVILTVGYAIVPDLKPSTTFVETRGRSLEEISRLFGEIPDGPRLSTVEAR